MFAKLSAAPAEKVKVLHVAPVCLSHFRLTPLWLGLTRKPQIIIFCADACGTVCLTVHVQRCLSIGRVRNVADKADHSGHRLAIVVWTRRPCRALSRQRPTW